ncbi:MAG: hypothetical protein ABJA66_17380 [Actinomycetota bacterium]
MKNSIRFVVSITLVFAFLFNGLPGVKACGPFTISTIFSLQQHADFPLSEFTNGKTGIVPETFGSMSLFVFYRQLDNSPFTKDEQTQIVDSMENKIFYRSGIFDKSETDGSGQETLPDHFEKWAAARAKVTNEKRDIETEKRIANEYNSFSNCLPDAFNNAAHTLESRINKYGTGEDIKDWLTGQDFVFSNCGGAKDLPWEVGSNAPEWLRKDREYQIAAAKFYMGDFVGSRESFEKIAADENSVWKTTAKLVAARTFIRQASFIKDSEDEAAKAQAEKDKKELLQKAAEKLQNILADNSMSEFHKSAYRLLGLVKYRMIPAERQKELADLLARSLEDQNIYNDLTDYTLLLDYMASQAEAKGSELDNQDAVKAGKEYDYNYVLKLRDVPAADRTAELTDWLFTYQAADGFQHAFEKWKETGKLQWFVAAITKTDAKSPQTAEILSEVDKIQSNSAAFATVRFHQIRLLLETGKRAEAKQKLDEVIANNLKNLPLSTQNKFFAQRMALAENLEDFLKDAQRKPVIFEWDENDREEGTSVKDDEYLNAWENRTMFDEDSVAFFNEKMPLSVLRQAALSPQIPQHLKRFLVIAVWTRAYILGNQAVEREFTPLMSRYAKEFAPFVSKYANASNANNREAAALIAILRYPVIQPYVPVGFGRENSKPAEIDSNRGNWWCTVERNDQDKNRPDNYPSIFPNFLTLEQTANAGRERKQLIATGNSATFLTRRAIEFANRNPNNPQIPEILHLAVRSTRFGCTDDDTLKLSKQAFDILHKRYPNSVWTKQTPFWFGQT